MGFGEILKGNNHFQLLRRFQFISGSESMEMLLRSKPVYRGFLQRYCRIHHISRLFKEDDLDAEISDACVDHLL